MRTVNTMAEQVGEQHQRACERVIHRFSIVLELLGLYTPGKQRLHDLVGGSVKFWPAKDMRSLIWIERPFRQQVEKAFPTFVCEVAVVTALDGNAWVTRVEEGPAQEKPTNQPSSGGSALYGSPQDATQTKICQPPSPSIWHEARSGLVSCGHCHRPLDAWMKDSTDCPCQSLPGSGAG